MTGIDDSNDRGADGQKATWTRTDFEAAIPLYVGGDLEPADAERVELWIAAHPEDAGLVRAADEARSVLLSHARTFERRGGSDRCPDLWPGVRAGIRDGLVRQAIGPERAPAHRAADAPREQAMAAAERRGWIQHPAFAAAAALLLVSTLGLGIARSGVPDGSGGVAPERTGDGAAAADHDAARFAAASRPAAISGTKGRPLDVTPAGAPAPRRGVVQRTAPGALAPRRGVPLYRTNGDAEHLLPSATPVHPWFPSLDPTITPATGDGVRLTGQR